MMIADPRGMVVEALLVPCLARVEPEEPKTNVEVPNVNRKEKAGNEKR